MIVYVAIAYSVLTDAIEVIGVYKTQQRAEVAAEQQKEREGKQRWYMEYEVFENELKEDV